MTARIPTIRVLRLAAGALVLAVLAGCGASTLPQIHAEQERLVQARRLMQKRDWGIAAELLTTYVQNNRGAADVDEALYLLGECHLKLKDWPGAQTDFERLGRDYPESDSAAAGEFMLAEAFWGGARSPDFDQDDTQKALTQWNQYLVRYPEHWRVPEAQARVAVARARMARKTLDAADLYVKQRYVTAARVYYRQVLDQYGDTPLVGDAQIGLALCDALEGDREPAVAALRELEARFPGTPLGARAARERERIEKGKLKPPKKRLHQPPSEGAPGLAP